MAKKGYTYLYLSNKYFTITESSLTPSQSSETTNRPLYEPRIPSSKTNIISSENDLQSQPSSYIPINEFMDQGKSVYQLSKLDQNINNVSYIISK